MSDRPVLMRSASSLLRASAILIGDDEVALELDESESLVRTIRREKATVACEQLAESIALANCMTLAELRELGAGGRTDQGRTLLRSIIGRSGLETPPVASEVPHDGVLEACWRVWDAHASKSLPAREPEARAPISTQGIASGAAPDVGFDPGPRALAPPQPDVPDMPEPISLAAYALLAVEIERTGDIDGTLARHGLTAADLESRVHPYWRPRLARDSHLAAEYTRLVTAAHDDWLDL